MLETERSQKIQYLFYGYVTAYLASIFGHRCGVFQNLKIEEVEGAVQAQQGAYLINVSVLFSPVCISHPAVRGVLFMPLIFSFHPQVNVHKTNQAFGPAQISLDPREYGWLKTFLGLREKLVGGPTAKFFFFTSTPNPCKNLNNHFQEAWKKMGLPGTPTFTDIRSSIATHVSRAPPPRVSFGLPCF
ncbi:MAG: hypothetical protein ACRDDA_00745 [Aeromonas sp.]